MALQAARILWVRQFIAHGSPVADGVDDARCAHHGKVLGRGRLVQAEVSGELAHATRADAKAVDDAQSMRAGERPQEARLDVIDVLAMLQHQFDLLLPAHSRVLDECFAPCPVMTFSDTTYIYG